MLYRSGACDTSSCYGTCSLVKHFSNEGDLIVVPFAGSGSECVAAKMNNRDFIGFEINDKYIPIIEERLAKTEIEATNILENDQ